MKSRRKAREVAIQLLYQCDTLSEWSDEVVDRFFANFFPQVALIANSELEVLEEDNFTFARLLIDGVRSNIERIDFEVSAISVHWSLARMARIDRNILRLATYEILFLDEVPTNVAINEAIEIAKHYSTDDSPMFINGILDQVASKNGFKEVKQAS